MAIEPLFFYTLWFVVIAIVAYIIVKMVVSEHSKQHHPINSGISDRIDELHQKTTCLNDDLTDLQFRHKILCNEVDKLNIRTDYIYQCMTESRDKASSESEIKE